MGEGGQGGPDVVEGDRAEQHQLVQIAEMADTKQLARDLGQPGAERKIVSERMEKYWAERRKQQG